MSDWLKWSQCFSLTSLHCSYYLIHYFYKSNAVTRFILWRWTCVFAAMWLFYSQSTNYFWSPTNSHLVSHGIHQRVQPISFLEVGVLLLLKTQEDHFKIKEWKLAVSGFKIKQTFDFKIKYIWQFLGQVIKVILWHEHNRPRTSGQQQSRRRKLCTDGGAKWHHLGLTCV